MLASNPDKVLEYGVERVSEESPLAKRSLLYTLRAGGSRDCQVITCLSTVTAVPRAATSTAGATGNRMSRAPRGEKSRPYSGRPDNLKDRFTPARVSAGGLGPSTRTTVRGASAPFGPGGQGGTVTPPGDGSPTLARGGGGGSSTGGGQQVVAADSNRLQNAKKTTKPATLPTVNQDDMNDDFIEIPTFEEWMRNHQCTEDEERRRKRFNRGNDVPARISRPQTWKRDVPGPAIQTGTQHPVDVVRKKVGAPGGSADDARQERGSDTRMERTHSEREFIGKGAPTEET